MSALPILALLPQVERNWAYRTNDEGFVTPIACECCGAPLYWHNCELTCERGCDPEDDVSYLGQTPGWSDMDDAS